MKIIIIILISVMAISCSQGLKVNDVPDSVKASLAGMYPKVKKVKWEKEKENYEAGFEIDETEYSVLLDVKGTILETEIEINKDALPAKVKEYTDKNYPGQKIKEAAQITDAFGSITYEAEIKDKDLIFDSNGNFIKEILKLEKDND